MPQVSKHNTAAVALLDQQETLELVRDLGAAIEEGDPQVIANIWLQLKPRVALHKEPERAMAEADEPNFNDFSQAYRYSESVETKLILTLPITDFRPEAMRVTERKTASDIWYEVETYDPGRNLWVDQKNHRTEAKAVADANGWYPPLIDGIAAGPGTIGGQQQQPDTPSNRKNLPLIHIGPIVNLTERVIVQEVEPGVIVTHNRKDFESIPVEVEDPAYRQKNDSADLFDAWTNSWAIEYKDNDTCNIKPTGGMIVIDLGNMRDKKQITPNAFIGKIVSETPSNYIQDIGRSTYVAHPKKLTGILEADMSYTIKHTSGQTLVTPKSIKTGQER